MATKTAKRHEKNSADRAVRPYVRAVVNVFFDRRILLFLCAALILVLCGAIAILTLPKISPRLAGMFMKAEARHSAWQNRVEKQSGAAAAVAETAITPAQAVLIVAGTAVGGGVILLGLAYLALFRSAVNGQPKRDDTVLECSENVVS
jgi:hypothetical protein